MIFQDPFILSSLRKLRRRKNLRRNQRRRRRRVMKSSYLHSKRLRRSLNHQSGHCMIIGLSSAMMSKALATSGTSMDPHRLSFQGGIRRASKSSNTTKSVVEVTTLNSEMRMTTSGSIITSMALSKVALNLLVQGCMDQEGHSSMLPLLQVNQLPLFLQLNLKIRSKFHATTPEILKIVGSSKRLTTRRSLNGPKKSKSSNRRSNSMS